MTLVKGNGRTETLRVPRIPSTGYSKADAIDLKSHQRNDSHRLFRLISFYFIPDDDKTFIRLTLDC
jgi:hypothetical protein